MTRPNHGQLHPVTDNRTHDLKMRLSPTAHNYQLLLSLLAVLVCGLWGLRVTYDFVRALPDTDIIAGDPVDTTLIVQGLEATSGWEQTLSWWTGPWVAWTGKGSIASFYRPLTSLLWWIEYRAFGRQGLYGFTTVHALSHLLVLMAALLFLRELLGLKIATLSVCLYGLHLPYYSFNLPDCIYALPMWKDSPDLWCSAAYLVSLWCFLKFMRGSSKWWLGSSICCFIVALSVKEMAYTLPFALLLLLYHERKLVSHWRFAVPFYLVAAGAFAFRFWALQGYGFRFGTNGSWADRWLLNVVGGAPVARLLYGDGFPLAIACLVAALLWGLTGKSRRWQLALVVAASWGLWLSARQGHEFEDPFYYQLAGSLLPWKNALLTLALLFLMWRFIANRQRGQAFGWLWVVITYIPLMTAPITQHALYLVALGWSIWLAYALSDILALAGTGRSLLQSPLGRLQDGRTESI
ncbi:MAG TPA: hypothetical protein VNA16_03390 [Abditibacteriaceae bacterium]|nr:hypothetical protein [Abditibacteriaceae bacterium]